MSQKDISRRILFPTHPTAELAEFIGILTGDGHVSFEKTKNKIVITGNATTDLAYYNNYLLPLLKNLFNLNLEVKKRNNKAAIIVYFYSQAMVKFLTLQGYYKLRTKVIVPIWIFKSKLYTCGFLRGLYDTDGCIFRSDKRGSPGYPCIELTTISFELANQVKESLLRFEFRVPNIRSYVYKHSVNPSYKVSLYGFANVYRWNKMISFSNPYKYNRSADYP
ncbi:MAG: LAGLIDADG family homing endonuclease [archaeon]